jgi:hypothetical protein
MLDKIGRVSNFLNNIKTYSAQRIFAKSGLYYGCNGSITGSN